jgi:Type IV secretory system Conjugative DNA transfer
MTWKHQINDHGVDLGYRDTDSGETVTAAEYGRREQMDNGMVSGDASLVAAPPAQIMAPGTVPAQSAMPGMGMQMAAPGQMSPIGQMPAQPMGQMPMGQAPQMAAAPAYPQAVAQPLVATPGNPLIQPGAQVLSGASNSNMLDSNAGGALGGAGGALSGMSGQPAASPLQDAHTGINPTAGLAVQGKSLRLEGISHGGDTQTPMHQKPHGFLDATSIAILLPTLVLLALIIAAAHKKRLFPWQTIRTFNPPSGLMTPRDYERSYLCPPNLRRHGRMGKRNPQAAWTETDGVVLPFGFLARTHLPVTIPLGRLPNKNMFLVAPSGSGKTTLMRAIIKALLAKPCVIIALEAKANDPNLDERREGFKYTVLPEAQHAGFNTLYFNPLDSGSIHWNPIDLDAISFASSIVQDINSLEAEEQHWAERDHGYIAGLTQLLKWGAVQVAGEDENGQPADIQALPCNPRGLMRLVNNRRNIVESLRKLKSNPDVDPSELSELTQTLTSIIRTDTDWDKNIQGVRGRLRMFKNPNVLRVTEHSNVDLKAAMHIPTVLIFGAPASLGPDAESLASCFVYQLQLALHTRYGTKSVLPLFAFFDEYQTLNIDLAGRLSAIVRGANGGLTVILQNISQITGGGGKTGDAAGSGSGGSEIKTIFSNSAIRVCLHNADETTARFFSEEIGKHAVVVPGISDHYMATGFGIFPTSWNRIHSQQVVARVDTDSIKRMEKHHGLVYLSPAGDPEYGEVKPLMVDLRGIEEIARLHLLHNVSSRTPEPDGDGNGGQPVDPSLDGGFIPPAPGGMGNGLPGFAMGQSGYQTNGAQVDAYGNPIAADAYGNAAAYAQPEANPQPAPYAAPGYAYAPQAYAPQNNFPAPQSAVQNAGPITNGNPNRICSSCSKPAGKGKFCIECGSFIGVAAADPARVELATTAAVVNTQPGLAYAEPAGQNSAPPFPGFARSNALQIAEAAPQNYANPGYGQADPQGAQPAPATASGAPVTNQRTPVTSFNLDPSKLGFAQPLAQQKAPKSGRVEF